MGDDAEVCRLLIAMVIKFINDFVATVMTILLTYVAVRWEAYREFSPAVLIMVLVVSYMTYIVTVLGHILDIVKAAVNNKAFDIIKILISVILTLTLLACAIATTILIDKNFRQDVRDALDNYKENGTETRVWDHVQQDFACCGIENYTDWIGQDALGNNSLPDSCCYLYYTGCGRDIVESIDLFADTEKTIFYKSCTQAGFFDFFYPWTYAVTGTAIGMNTLNIIAVILTGEDGESFDAGMSD